MAGEENLRQDADEVLPVGAPSFVFPKFCVSQVESTDVTDVLVLQCVAWRFFLEVFCLHDYVVKTPHGLPNCWCDRSGLDCCSPMGVCVLFAAASSKSYLSFLRSLRKTLLDLCPTMAVLFVLVLMAFVKHVAGMRGNPQTESMFETDVTLWGKKCAQFGAKKKSWWSNTCQCPEELPFPRNCEGRSGRSFNLKKTIKEGSNCRCEEDPCEKFGAELHDTDPTEIQIYDKEWSNVQRIAAEPPRNATAAAAPSSASTRPPKAAAVCHRPRSRSSSECRSRPRRCASAVPWRSRAMKKKTLSSA